jgi:signal transduction histidine kinase/CHASE3 domain sensor protein
MLDHNVSSIRAAEELELQIREFRTELNRYLLTDDEQHLTTAIALRPEIDRWCERARRCALTVKEKTLVAAMDRDLERFFAEIDQFREAHALERREPIVQLIQGRLFSAILANARSYLNVNEQDLERSREDGRTMTRRVVWALLLLGACGSIAGLLYGYGLARGINRSILHLSHPIRDVAGKLNEVVGPVPVSADPGLEDLHRMLGHVSDEVAVVVDQLLGAQREMVRADQLSAIGQLAAGLAHELRNPLMAMKVLVQSARRTDVGAKGLGERDLQVLEEEIARLENLLQTFLDFAKPARLEMSPCDVRELVGSSLQLLSRRAELKGVDMVAHLDDCACLVEADAAQIRQVLLNLLLNALDATPEGGVVEVRIRSISTSSTDRTTDTQQPGGIELTVTDTGSGLPRENRHRIFDPFFSTRETGLGLGLAICRRIVESHRGVISAEDRPGGGAVFSILLPASHAASAPLAVDPVISTAAAASLA